MALHLECLNLLFRTNEIVPFRLNLLPHNRILDKSKWKHSAVDKLDLTSIIEFASDREENILGKGENAGYQCVLLFSKCFHKPSSLASLKVVIVW